MKIFVVRLSPDLRNCTPYSKYPSKTEYTNNHSQSSMDGFHEAVNFLSERGTIYGYLPPRHSKTLRNGEPFCLVSITAKMAKTGGDQIIGIQVGCQYTGGIVRQNKLKEVDAPELTYHYECSDSLSLLLGNPIPNARKIILKYEDLWIRGPVKELGKKSAHYLINEIENSIQNDNELRKFNTLKSLIFEKKTNQRNINLDLFQTEVKRYFSEDNKTPTGNFDPKLTISTSYQYIRDPAVVAYALKRANGKCEECGNNAPFISLSTGLPFLEVHHEIFLSQGGSDTVDNVKALCPNCHRKKHFG